jgi:hypothetical protein
MKIMNKNAKKLTLSITASVLLASLLIPLSAAAADNMLEKCYFYSKLSPSCVKNPDGSFKECYEPNPADTSGNNCNTNATSSPLLFVSGCKVVPGCGWVRGRGTCVGKEGGSSTPVQKK